MSAFVLILTTLGAQATSIAKTNNTAGFADDSILARTVTFVEDVDFAAGSAVQDVNVAVNFEKIDGTCPTHGGGLAFNSEIFMYLESPTGTQVALIENALNSAGSGTGATYTGPGYGGLAAVTFDDWAVTTVGGLVPTSGTFKPVEPLSAFKDETPIGDWTLNVGDSAPDDPLCFYEFTVTIDAAQPPVVNNQSFDVVEQSANGTEIGTVVANDNDAGDKLTYTITSGNSAGIFALNKLTGKITVANGSLLDYETTTSYTLNVKVTDSSGLWDTAVITINVLNANEAPTDITLDSSSVLEHVPTGTAVGNFTTSDPDTGDSHTYTLVAGTGADDNASFKIVGNELQTNAVFNFEDKSSYTIRVQTADGNGGTFAKQFTITIVDGNDPPTDIALDSTSVAENQPADSVVGNFSSTDNLGDTHTYTLVTGTGADDNASFKIVGGQLQTAASFNFETDASYSIRVRSTDDGALWFEKVFTITISDANDAPTGISLDNDSVAENQSTGTAVGNFSTTDEDVADSHTYSFATGVGDADNGSFQIVGSQLRTNASFDFEVDASYSIRIQTDDGNGGTFEKAFTIMITDANDNPSNIGLDNNSVLEHQAVGTLVGNFSTTDQDSSDSHTYSLVENGTYPDNASFTISSGQLKTAVVFDFDVRQTYTIKVQTDDGNGGTFSKEFTINITDGNDPPTDIALDNASVAENQAAGTAVGNFSTTDPNGGDTHSYTLVSGSGADHNTSFKIVGNELQTNAIFDRETLSTYSIRVRSTDDGTGNLWFEKVFTITITDANDTPTNISLDNSSVAENQAAGTAVGNFSTTDPDSGDSHTYTLVVGSGSTDNGSFKIVGSQLQTDAVFDRETKSSYSIRVRSTDNGTGNLWFEKVFTITISNVNETPTDIALSSSSVAENRVAGTAVGNFSTTDPDSGDSFTYTLVTGAGDTHNSSFQIVSGQLRTAAKFDYETQSTYYIRVQTRDGGGLTFAKEFTITVTDDNDAPVGVDDKATTDEDTVLNVPAKGVLANDTDQDVTDTLSVMSADMSSAQGAVVNVAANGGFSYNPTAVTALQALNVGQVLTDTFTYMVTDGGISFDTATVSIGVTGVNDAPTANDDPVTTVLETAVIVSPLTNDTDPDTIDTKSIVSFTQGTHGTVSNNGNGTLTYTPAAGYIGSDSFTYTMQDSHGARGTATVKVTVNPETYYTYVPVILNNYTAAPDLVITSLKASSDYVEVVIENQGDQATASGFWVDFYVDPNPVPVAANELWPSLTTQGIAWGVTKSLSPGAVLTLTYSKAPGAPNLYFAAQYSSFTNPLPVGTTIFAQVDSARVGSPNGAIEENHEIMGGVYNNIFQDVATAVSPPAQITSEPTSSSPSAILPTRH